MLTILYYYGTSPRPNSFYIYHLLFNKNAETNRVLATASHGALHSAVNVLI